MIIKPLSPDYIDKLVEIEKVCFHDPWSKQDFERELFTNNLAIYLAALENDELLGYAGMWHVINEGHITNIAVSPERRRLGIGACLLQELINIAICKEMMGLTLEVNISNTAAQKLYTKYGFKPEGLRKGYYNYNESKEDAIIMWKYL